MEKRFYKGDKCEVCKKDVTIKNRTGKCRVCRMIGNKYGIGNIKSEKERIKLSDRMKSEHNPMWRGEDVGLKGLHDWMRKRLLKPKLCERCGKVPPLDIANKGIYSRDFENWEYLCRRCHMLSDGRLMNLKQFHEE